MTIDEQRGVGVQAARLFVPGDQSGRLDRTTLRVHLTGELEKVP